MRMIDRSVEPFALFSRHDIVVRPNDRGVGAVREPPLPPIFDPLSPREPLSNHSHTDISLNLMAVTPERGNE